MKYIPNAKKFGIQSRSSNLKYDIWKLWILTQNWADLISKLKCAPTFMKFGTQCKSNMLIMNMVLGTDDLDPKLQIWANFGLTWKFALIFMELGTHNKWNMVIMNITMICSAHMIIGSDDYKL